MVQQLTIVLNAYEGAQIRRFLAELHRGPEPERSRQLAEFIESLLFGGKFPA